jgi:hypothetical protein
MLSALESLKIGSDFLLDFEVADVSFSLVIRERYIWLKMKTDSRIMLICKLIEHVLPLGIFGLSSSFLHELEVHVHPPAGRSSQTPAIRFLFRVHQ